MPSTTGTDSGSNVVPSGKPDRTDGAIHGVGPASRPDTSRVATPAFDRGTRTGAGTSVAESRVK